MLKKNAGNLSRAWCLSALAPSALALVLADNWLEGRASRGELIATDYTLVRQAHHQFIAGFADHLLPQLARSNEVLFQSLCYLALFCLPLLPFLLAGCFKKLKSHKLHRPLLGFCAAAALFLGLAVYGTAVVNHCTMPFSENIWRVTTVGAQGIMGIAHPTLSHRQRVSLTVFSYISASILLGLAFWFLLSVLKRKPFLGKSRGRSILAPSLLILTGCAIGFIAVETAVRTTDRYDLFALVPTLLCLILLSRYLRVNPGALTRALVVAFAIYSVCGGEDYLASNRARFSLIRKLENQGVTYKDIDGGAEYNIQNDLSVYTHTEKRGTPRDNWRWWSIHGEQYIVSFSPVPGYIEVMKAGYFSLLSFRREFVLMLKSEDGNK